LSKSASEEAGFASGSDLPCESGTQELTSESAEGRPQSRLAKLEIQAPERPSVAAAVTPPGFERLERGSRIQPPHGGYYTHRISDPGDREAAAPSRMKPC
jgi:hypothetical protein